MSWNKVGCQGAQMNVAYLYSVFDKVLSVYFSSFWINFAYIVISTIAQYQNGYKEKAFSFENFWVTEGNLTFVTKCDR